MAKVAGTPVCIRETGMGRNWRVAELWIALISIFSFNNSCKNNWQTDELPYWWFGKKKIYGLELGYSFFHHKSLKLWAGCTSVVSYGVVQIALLWAICTIFWFCVDSLCMYVKDCDKVLENFWTKKNRTTKASTKRTETNHWHPTQCTYIPNPLCAVIQQNELEQERYCTGDQWLVSVLFVAVLVTLFFGFKSFITFNLNRVLKNGGSCPRPRPLLHTYDCGLITMDWFHSILFY